MAGSTAGPGSTRPGPRWPPPRRPARVRTPALGQPRVRAPKRGRQARDARGGQHSEGPTGPEHDPEGGGDPHAVARAIVLRRLALAPRAAPSSSARCATRGCSDQVAGRSRTGSPRSVSSTTRRMPSCSSGPKQATRGLARSGLAHELANRGIDRDTAAAALAAVGEGSERPGRAGRQSFATSVAAPMVQARRLSAMLARKGIPPAWSMPWSATRSTPPGSTSGTDRPQRLSPRGSPWGRQRRAFRARVQRSLTHRKCVGGDDLLAERHDRHREQFEVGTASGMPMIVNGLGDGRGDMAEGQPPAGDDEPTTLASGEPVPAVGVEMTARPKGHRAYSPSGRTPLRAGW